MQTSEILAAIDEEIERLQQARKLLAGDGRSSARRAVNAASAATAFSFGSNKSAAPKKRRKLSAEGRARIAAAQKARWAKAKKSNRDKK